MQIPRRAELLPKIKQVSPENFEEVAMAVFHFQSAQNPLFSKFLKLLGRSPEKIQHPDDIPFLPISFFKNHHIKSGKWTAETMFSSSGTSGQTTSKHAVRDLDFYLENTQRCFSKFYGDPTDWCVLALLPSYLERGGSSLVAMADHFIKISKHPATRPGESVGRGGFFLDDFEKLKNTLIHCQSTGCKTLLLGVSFALLDFAEKNDQKFHLDLSGVVVMETGGMKGRRRELTRPELHEILCNSFKINEIHSEYGMTEMFSQAYAMGGTVFRPAPTLRILATEVNDPFCKVNFGKTGVVNLIDLANLDTCSFIATEDVGRVFADGSFEVLGRLDLAEMRGCNLMVTG